MAAVETGKAKTPLWRDAKARGLAYQVLLCLLIAFFAWAAISNAVENLARAKIASGFGGFGGGLVFARWFIGWLTVRHDTREAALRAEDSELDHKWRAYRETIEAENAALRARVHKLEEQNAECHDKTLELERRLARLEGFASARGELRNEDQAVASAKRLIDGG